MSHTFGRRETSIVDETRDWFGGGGGELECEYLEDDDTSYDDEGDERYHSDKHEER